TINPETRRSGGMHYTSQDNIHKVIDPLFLRDLREEFNRIKNFKKDGNRINRLKEFQKELGHLKFLDPACGSGNFLTETFLCLRRLENDVMREIYGGQTSLQIEELKHPIYVTLDQFYGIEINEFAVAVAQTALWIADLQMKKETELIIQSNLDYLPLVSYNHIRCANALRIDWNDIVPASELSYIMGNPPFAGTKLQNRQQKEDMKIVFFNNDKYKKLDYVASWYKKSADYLENIESVHLAFVSTNSLVQGEMIDILWKQLFEEYKFSFDFAYRTFKWDSDIKSKASVSCVILGCSKNNYTKSKEIYSVDKEGRVTNTQICKNINGYLMAAESVFVEKRQKPLNNSLMMIKGAQLIDGGHFVFESRKEYEDFIKKEPRANKYVRKYYNSRNFLNDSVEQFCLYLEDADPTELSKMPLILERIALVKQFRENSDADSVKNLASTPSKYFIANIPSSKSIVIPIVSSEKRSYLPIKFSNEGTIYTNALNFIEGATLYDFGILTSSTHMSWMRTVAGRLKSDYRYSKDIVYNNFIWPEVNESQKEKVIKTAQAILDARTLYPDSSLADLYDPLTMPIELLKAHEANDKAVLSLYGLAPDSTEEQIVAHLMELYKQKVDELEPEKKSASVPKKPRKKKESIQSEPSVESTQTVQPNTLVSPSPSDSKDEASVTSSETNQSEIQNGDINAKTADKKKEP
ncbi:DNA methyltransferase, partial [Succinivibrio sp.]|uniref:class I SAM-dependent DNA methyltransferase n=1 Tax=Succinivibrio sp. TaxID=2053619 RepID=UPI0025D0B4B8